MASFLSPRQDPNTVNHLLDFLSNPFQGQIQIKAFWVSLGTSVGVTLFLALFFSFLRPRHTLVYAPKIKHADPKHALPPMGKGPFAWIKPVTKTKEAILVDKIGLDAVVFLRFTRMLRNIFLILSVIGIGIMLPVNVSASNAVNFADKDAPFAIMTPVYAFGQWIWAQVVVAYAINLVVCYFLWHNYRRIFALRRAYFEHPDYQQSLHAHSVMIRHVPAKFRTEEGLLQLTDEVNPTGSPAKPIPNRNVKVLPELIEEHEETVRELESVLAKYLRNPNQLPAQRPTVKPPRSYRGQMVNGKVDAIEYLGIRVKELEAQIAHMRETINKRDAMPYGFACWDKVAQAHSVAYAARRKNPHGAKVRLAPRPGDIIWKNLPLSKAALRRKSLMNFVWVAVLTVLWTPINAGIAIFLSNLSNLGSIWPAFERNLGAHKTSWAFVQGIASPALTSLVYLMLPIIFRRLQIRAGDVTKTARERHVLRNLYLFFILNNLIVFSIFSAIWQYITSVIKGSETTDVWEAMKAEDLFLKLMFSLCQVSPFWVTWLLQRNLGAAIDIAQLWTIFYQWFAKTFLAPTPRQHIEWTAPPSFLYASYYNYFLFYATVGLCFATLQPIILLVTAIYFVIDAVLKKYLLMYVFVTKTESGGQFWRTLFNRMVFAVALADVFIGVVVKARGNWTMVCTLAPLLLSLIGFKIYCMKAFDKGLHFYHTSEMADSEHAGAVAASSKALDRASVKFGHPALDQPLMTPMVNARARDILRQIYHGRVGSDAGPPTFPSDIAMHSMSDRYQPPQDAEFEFVPEAQQDFTYYKDRSDFREEAGNLTGKPEDLISRSGTPASFMKGEFRDDGSPYSSRAASPVPRPGEQTRNPVNRSTVHPAYRHSKNSSYDALAQSDGLDGSDIGLEPRHTGPYTDPNDDRTNLLRGVDDVRIPNGEFVGLEQWQSQGPTPVDKNAGGSYDYFRTGQR